MSRILLFDDDELMRDLMITVLGLDHSLSFAYAVSGLRAVERVEIECPDCILLDVMLPGLDGFEVCREIKADARIAHIPVILITAMSGTEPRDQAIAAGADDYIQKPTFAFELRLRVRNALRLKAALDRIRELEDKS